MSDYLDKWSQLHGHARPSRIVRFWLRIVSALARPLIRFRLSPNMISIIGVLVAIAAWWLAPHPFVSALVILSLVIDGLDGAVAVITDRVSIWGGFIDSVLDRVGEAFLAATLVRFGADLRLVLLAWALSLIQEYARARSLTLAPTMKVKASVCERPVRALVIAAACAMTISPIWKDELSPTVWASVWLTLQAVGVVQVWANSRAALR